MDNETYSLITNICRKKLQYWLHNDHLEDCIQYCALEYIKGRKQIAYCVLDYLRTVGFGKRGHKKNKPLNDAISLVDFGVENIVDEKINLKNEDIIYDFLSPLNINEGTMLWIINNYKIDRKILR